jgi:membrane-associated protease RseP (regulator of RpoE activity)
MKRLLAIAALVVLSGGLLADTPAAETKPVAVPFELLKSGHMAVMVKINGKGPYRVIFDTGAPVTLFNNKIAKEANLQKNAKQTMPIFGMGGQVTVQELEVGDLKADGVAAIIMDHPTVSALSMALGPIEGIVGFPFFARYKMTLDYQAKEMTFVPTGFKPPDVMQKMMAVVMTMQEKPVAKIIAAAGQWGMVVSKEKDDDEPGTTVKEVHAGSAADAAGLKAGDRLLTIDGRWTDSVADCYTAAGFVKAGKSAHVVVERKSQKITLTVKPRDGL